MFLVNRKYTKNLNGVWSGTGIHYPVPEPKGFEPMKPNTWDK